MNRALRCALAAAAVLLAPALASCSATKLAYDNADFLVSWEVGKFIDLKGPSQDAFDQGFKSVWQWHRQTQLRLYARDLREIAQAAAQPMTREQVANYVVRAQAHADRLVEQALPPTAAVLAALTDKQVARMLERLAEQRADDAEDRAEQTPEETREDAIRRIHKSMKRWLGSITPEQEARGLQWAAQMPHEPALEGAAREEWAQAFAGLMQQRGAPDFEAKLAALLKDPQLPSTTALEELRRRSNVAGAALISDLSEGLSARQRQHLRDELGDLATDFEALAAKPVE